MKSVKVIIGLLIIGILAVGVTAFFEYKQISDKEAPIQTITFNNNQIAYSEATIRYSLLGGLIPIDQTYQNEGINLFQSDQILNTLIFPEGSDITITYPDQSIQTTLDSQELSLEENGEYRIGIETNSKDGSIFHYAFLVQVNARPLINISNLSPVQGELLVVDISNIKQNSLIEVESHFRPSAIIQKDHEARFYLPMAYREVAKSYPLSLEINGESFEYTIDVQPYAFKEVHFTVQSSVVSSTVGNTDAVDQYRATIYPMYETFETEEYWEGSFVVPVEGARQSSSFGEMRFVNDSKTATRHAGIDYAIACGTDVVASNAGKVEFAGFLTMIGNTIVIDHGLGLKTFYEHMEDTTIKQGDMVEKGQVIGHVGTTGYSTGCHLHFQGMVKNQSINPEFLFKLDNR